MPRQRQHDRLGRKPKWTICEGVLKELRLIPQTDCHGHEFLVLSGRVVASHRDTTEGFVYYRVNVSDLHEALQEWDESSISVSTSSTSLAEVFAGIGRRHGQW